MPPHADFHNPPAAVVRRGNSAKNVSEKVVLRAGGGVMPASRRRAGDRDVEQESWKETVINRAKYWRPY